MAEGRTPTSIRNRRKRLAYQKVADDLRDRIVDGRLVVGDRLPTEEELAAEYEVSRSTIREALRALVARDLLVTRRGTAGGTYVAPVRIDQVTDYLETSIGMMSSVADIDVEEILVAREVLEVPAARRAANQRTDEDLELMREALDREKSLVGNKGRFSKHRTFHQLIAEASRNTLLEMMSEPVFRVLETKYLNDDLPHEVYEGLWHDHAAIFAAVEAGDGEAAARLMADHLASLRGVYRG